MFEDKDLRVIVSIWDNNEMYIIAADDVAKVYLHDCYNQYGQKIDEDEVGDIECEAIQYWDGHNNRSAIIGDEEEGADYEYADDELENEILKEFSNIETPEYKAGVAIVKGEKYSFRFSQYQNKNFCICEVSERSPFDDEE